MALPQRYVEKDHYTEEEYLRREEACPFRSEYVGGLIRAVPDSTADYSLLLVSLGATLHSALRVRGCRVLSCQMKVWMPKGTIRYPDLSVLRGPGEYRGAGRLVITNPVLIAEVLADNTEAVDRGEKWLEYQTIESLQCYLLVNQTSPRVECYERRENGRWDYQAVIGRDSILEMPTLGITLALAELYDEISFAAETEETQDTV